ncbi:MAG: diguanylate cyclase [Acidobacteriota bacterium]
MEINQPHREGLQARIDALGAARKALRAKSPEAADSIRRLARSVRVSGQLENCPGVIDAARALEESDDEHLSALLEQLLTSLKAAVVVIPLESTKVLVVEDDPVTARVLESVLSSPGREILFAETAAVAERILEENEISLLILDLMLPDADGRTVLLHLSEYYGSAGVPVFILSSRGGVEDKTECFALGADEYFEKPFNPEVISAAVAAKLQRSAEISRRARQDLLTALPNRVALQETFDREQSLRTRVLRPLSLAMLDFDHFKEINDTYGHSTGDAVLRQGASLISQTFRGSDVLGRWGGEEFVVLFPNTNLDGAMSAVEKALSVFRRKAFEVNGRESVHLSFSAGVVEVSEGASIDGAVEKADQLLYLAKAAGGNCVLPEASTEEPEVQHTVGSRDQA